MCCLKPYLCNFDRILELLTPKFGPKSAFYEKREVVKSVIDVVGGAVRKVFERGCQIKIYKKCLRDAWCMWFVLCANSVMYD